MVFLRSRKHSVCLSISLFLCCMTFPLSHAFNIREISCGKTSNTFNLGDDISCLRDDGKSNCDMMGLFADEKNQCYRCCNSTATSEPPNALSTVKVQTVRSLPVMQSKATVPRTTRMPITTTITTRKTVPDQERLLTTEKAFATEDEKKAKFKSSNDMVEIWQPVLYSLCGVLTMVGIVFLVNRLIRCRRNRHVYRRSPQQPHPQPSRTMTYVGTPTQENLFPYSTQESHTKAIGTQSSQETTV